jgi:hypothetical protein
MFIVPITCLISLCPTVISPIRPSSHQVPLTLVRLDNHSPFTLFQDYLLLCTCIASCPFIASLPPTRPHHIPTFTFTSPSELFMCLISRSLENSNDAIPSKHYFRWGWTLQNHTLANICTHTYTHAHTHHIYTCTHTPHTIYTCTPHAHTAFLYRSLQVGTAGCVCKMWSTHSTCTSTINHMYQDQL